MSWKVQKKIQDFLGGVGTLIIYKLHVKITRKKDSITMYEREFTSSRQPASCMQRRRQQQLHWDQSPELVHLGLQ